MISLLIFLTGFVSLNVSTSRHEMISQDYHYLQIRQFSNDQYDTEEASGKDHLDLCYDSKETFLPEEIPGQHNMHLPVPFRHRLTSNPLLFDLPPPVIPI